VAAAAQDDVGEVVVSVPGGDAGERGALPRQARRRQRSHRCLRRMQQLNVHSDLCDITVIPYQCWLLAASHAAVVVVCCVLPACTTVHVCNGHGHRTQRQPGWRESSGRQHMARIPFIIMSSLTLLAANSQSITASSACAACLSINCMPPWYDPAGWLKTMQGVAGVRSRASYHCTVSLARRGCRHCLPRHTMCAECQQACCQHHAQHCPVPRHSANVRVSR
jgi:hypothetical protein